MVIMDKVDIHLEDKIKSRYFFVFLWIVYSVVYMTKNNFSVAMANIVAEGILSKTQTGFINALFYFVYAPLQVVGGIMVDKHSPEKLLNVGLIGALIVNMIVFFNHNYHVILVVWLFNAIIQTPIWPATFKIISSQLVRSDRKNMIFLTSFSNSFGLILGYAVAAVISSWRNIFLVSSISLLICIIILQIFCKKLDTYMKPDKKDIIIKERVQKINVSSFKLFATSGFFLICICVMLRGAVENGAKMLAPTMLMEMYEKVSPSIGNFLNLFILTSSAIGLLFVEFLIYPRFIMNETTAMLVMLFIAIPFSIALRSVGNIPISVAVISLCGISATLTATHLLAQYYNMRFVKYGKNGTAAGISNSAGCVGMMLQSYGFVHIAEKYSWNVVTTLWLVIIGISAVFVALAIPMHIKFIRMKQTN